MHNNNSETMANKTLRKQHEKTTYTRSSLFISPELERRGDGDSHVYDVERFHLKNICQFENNPDLQTTIRSWFDSKHVDERARIVQETANKIS